MTQKNAVKFIIKNDKIWININEKKEFITELEKTRNEISKRINEKGINNNGRISTHQTYL